MRLKSFAQNSAVMSARARLGPNPHPIGLPRTISGSQRRLSALLVPASHVVLPPNYPCVSAVCNAAGFAHAHRLLPPLAPSSRSSSTTTSSAISRKLIVSDIEQGQRTRPTAGIALVNFSLPSISAYRHMDDGLHTNPVRPRRPSRIQRAYAVFGVHRTSLPVMTVGHFATPRLCAVVSVQCLPSSSSASARHRTRRRVSDLARADIVARSGSAHDLFHLGRAGTPKRPTGHPPNIGKPPRDEHRNRMRRGAVRSHLREALRTCTYLRVSFARTRAGFRASDGGAWA